jgi:hypothetical protein
MRPPPESADFQGEIETFGSIGAAYLFADENRLYLRAPFVRYQFTPSEVVALEESGDRGIAVKHIRPDYPEKIIFNSSGNSSAEMLLAIASKGFLFCATTDGIPTREGSPIRNERLFSMYIILNLLFFLVFIVGYFLGILPIDYPPVEPGSWSAVISLSTTFTTFAFIRFCRPVHWLLLKPGRYMSEIGPTTDIWIIALGLLAAANFLIYLGIPKMLTVGIEFLFLWTIVQIDMKLIP